MITNASLWLRRGGSRPSTPSVMAPQSNRRCHRAVSTAIVCGAVEENRASRNWSATIRAEREARAACERNAGGLPVSGALAHGIHEERPIARAADNQRHLWMAF